MYHTFLLTPIHVYKLLSTWYMYIRRFISKGEKSLKSVFALLKKMDNTLMLVRLPLPYLYMYICICVYVVCTHMCTNIIILSVLIQGEHEPDIFFLRYPIVT